MKVILTKSSKKLMVFSHKVDSTIEFSKRSSLGLFVSIKSSSLRHSFQVLCKNFISSFSK